MSKHRKRPQAQKPRLPRPRSVVFTDRMKDADKKAARGSWLSEDLLDEIENWEDYV